jgi:hypothetical protein
MYFLSKYINTDVEWSPDEEKEYDQEWNNEQWLI